MDDAKPDACSGWVFRLNVPASAASGAGGPPGGSDDCADDGSDEGVQLLPKRARADGGVGSSPPSLGCLAELSPRGASVASPSSESEGVGGGGAVCDDDATTDAGRRSREWSWSFSSRSSPSGWNVTSSRLLSATYRPASEALPSYTNVSRGRECWQKTAGACCRGRRKGARTVTGRGGPPRGRWDKARARMAGHPRPIRRVRVDYTADDVWFVEPIVASSAPPGSKSEARSEENDDEGGVWIRGVGNCHALRVHLRPKFGSYPDDERDEGDNPNDNSQSELPPMDRWDSLPPPPWDRPIPDGAKGDKANPGKKSARRWGPVLTFAIPCRGREGKETAAQRCPPLLWKVDHPPNRRVALESFLLMDGALHLQPACDAPTHVYVNGYQSWSFSGSVTRGAAQPRSAMPDMFSAAFNRGGMVPSGGDVWSGDGDPWDERPGDRPEAGDGLDAEEEEALDEATAFYKSDMFACISSDGAAAARDDGRVLLDEEGGPALVVGFLSQRRQYGAILMDRDLRRFDVYACHEGVVARQTATSDWAYCQIVDASAYDEEAMVYYVHAMGDHNGARPMEKGLTCGWCSWYHYYSDIDHDSLSNNARILEKSKDSIGFNVCLIDDGYMTAWGDWTSLKPGKFVADGGMRVLSDAIRERGMRPGVWLAPFACDKSSRLAREHPDWIIRNDYGRPANSANCGKFFYGLDATNPAVRKHVYDTIKRSVEEWNFDVLKLDFLYASCLEGNGKHDPSMSRAEAMYLGLRTIRAAAGDDTFIIGCGCPIGSAVGFVDGMRVSCDTGPTFFPEFPFPRGDNGTLPALRGMLRNTMSRSPLGHRWWHNDPDCLLLGESTKLTDDEVVSAASIVAMTGGMFLLSDDMEKVSGRRLSVAKRIFPLTGVTAVPLDLHSTINGGMPSILRLWCAEKPTSGIVRGQASQIEREAGYSPASSIDPYSRERSCFSVVPGLGSWTVVSLSNWLEHSANLSVSFSALVSHSIKDFVAMGAPRSSLSLAADGSTPGEMLEHGFHVFSFWSSEYVWIPHQTLVDNSPLIKRLKPHETEIFHIKPADPTRPQYIGSDLHFSCGFEVLSFDWSKNRVMVRLKNDYKKKGFIFIYLPENKGLDRAAVTANGKPGNVVVVARPSIGNGHKGRVVRVYSEIEGTGGENDGFVSISW